MMAPDELHALLQRAFPDATVTVTDLTGTADHYRVDVVSRRFAGKSAIDRHRMVYDVVGDRLTREIHALEVRTDVPGGNLPGPGTVS
jgi:stress-induced morphogen